MSPIDKIDTYFNRKDINVAKVVDFDIATDHLYPFDFTNNNKELIPAILNDTDLFTDWVEEKLALSKSIYGIGGYNEHRTIYARSLHFDGEEEPRRLHLGVDIWGKSGTAVYSFLPATVHSFKFNDEFGDYGATMILKYDLDGFIIHALYGHLNLASLNGLQIGESIAAGQQFAAFGIPEENGHWPPHLHFQLILAMNDYNGDYPGVCQFSQRSSFLENSPNPAAILRHTFQ